MNLNICPIEVGALLKKEKIDVSLILQVVDECLDVVGLYGPKEAPSKMKSNFHLGKTESLRVLRQFLKKVPGDQYMGISSFDSNSSTHENLKRSHMEKFIKVMNEKYKL